MMVSNYELLGLLYRGYKLAWLGLLGFISSGRAAVSAVTPFIPPTAKDDNYHNNDKAEDNQYLQHSRVHVREQTCLENPAEG